MRSEEWGGCSGGGKSMVSVMAVWGWGGSLRVGVDPQMPPSFKFPSPHSCCYCADLLLPLLLWSLAAVWVGDGAVNFSSTSICHPT